MLDFWEHHNSLHLYHRFLCTALVPRKKEREEREECKKRGENRVRRGEKTVEEQGRAGGRAV
jgi:hypothetical protein